MLKIKKNLIKNKIIELALVSTSHGLPSVFRTERKILKVIWLFLFLFGCGYGTSTVIKSISDYFDYPVVTNIEEIYQKSEIEYPQISFINLNYPKLNLTLEKSIVYCYFNLENCNSSDFEMIQDELGFVSYKFNKNKASFSGAFYGFALILSFGNLSQYKNQMTGINGMRFVLHNKTLTNGLNGGYSDRGINAGFGQHNEITIRRIDTKKLDKPFNDCIKNIKSIDSFHSSLYKYILNSTKYSYTQQYCLDLCEGRETFKYFNITNKIDSLLNVYYKLISLNVSLKDLISFYSAKVINIAKLCYQECPLECDSIDYQYSVSSVNMDKEQFISNSLNINGFNLDFLNNNNTENFISLRMYYDKASYTSINEIRKIEIVDLIANIGGNLGLFLGVSFLSFAEIFELILEAFFILTQKNNNITNN
jgi:hypothetical protein